MLCQISRCGDGRPHKHQCEHHHPVALDVCSSSPRHDRQAYPRSGRGGGPYRQRRGRSSASACLAPLLCVVAGPLSIMSSPCHHHPEDQLARPRGGGDNGDRDSYHHTRRRSPKAPFLRGANVHGVFRLASSFGMRALQLVARASRRGGSQHTRASHNLRGDTLRASTGWARRGLMSIPVYSWCRAAFLAPYRPGCGPALACRSHRRCAVLE
jgi:hypothetical protein